MTTSVGIEKSFPLRWLEAVRRARRREERL
jgi:hypothetical protein